ncbi:hypothetical protein [Flavobacterium gawalongense]|uniref:Uncharacterized protein n=1 Tax=Flavobacterium gawalongense TaxID=2594432 RepID=A0ABY3CKL9_9FLAO|nr:hypothetical protein [Flavobacterium gawalongense]TRX01376.1 hypothetical protein FNW33_09700 [Flavobacterium gawalongense]TRX05900.1 hypothetical protein FNW12_09785 [Flavobacterium gawalongense]
MTSIKFEDYKERISEKINQNVLFKNILVDPEGFLLLDGFFNIPFQPVLNGSINLGGPTIPAVAIIGKGTGLIHYFALKALLPDIEI